MDGTWIEKSFMVHHCGECEVEYPCPTIQIFNDKYITEWDEINEQFTLRIL